MPDHIDFYLKSPPGDTFSTRSQLYVVCHVTPSPILPLGFLPLKFCVKDNINIEAMN